MDQWTNGSGQWVKRINCSRHLIIPILSTSPLPVAVEIAVAIAVAVALVRLLLRLERREQLSVIKIRQLIIEGTIEPFRPPGGFISIHYGLSRTSNATAVFRHSDLEKLFHIRTHNGSQCLTQPVFEARVKLYQADKGRYC